MNVTDTLKGKRKSRWKNSSAIKEEDQLQLRHFKILECGVLTYYSWPLLIQTFLFWVERRWVLYRSDVNSPHISNFNTRLRGLLSTVGA
jgi:hypothetical protein